MKHFIYILCFVVVIVIGVSPLVALGQQISGPVGEVDPTTGATEVTPVTTTAGESVGDDVLKVEQRGYYTNITLAAPTTTVIKSGPGWLQNIIINKAVATGVITCYDNTAASGAVIATITQPAAVLASQIVLPYHTSFSVGLTCVTATAAQDITVVVR